MESKTELGFAFFVIVCFQVTETIVKLFRNMIVLYW